MTDHDDTETLAALHREHLAWTNGPGVVRCYCGEPIGEDRPMPIAETIEACHARHVGQVLAAYVARKVEAIERERDEAQAEASDVGHDYDRRGERLWRLAALAGWTPGNESDNDATAEAYVTDALTEARAVIERVLADCDGAVARESVLGEQVVTVRWLQAALAPATEPASDRPLTLDEHLADEAAAERRGAVNALRTIATQIGIEIPAMRADHVLPYDRLATWLRERADRIEAGDA